MYGTAAALAAVEGPEGQQLLEVVQNTQLCKNEREKEEKVEF